MKMSKTLLAIPLLVLAGGCVAIPSGSGYYAEAPTYYVPPPTYYVPTPVYVRPSVYYAPSVSVVVPHRGSHSHGRPGHGRRR